MLKKTNKSRREFTKKLALGASAPMLTPFCATSLNVPSQKVASKTNPKEIAAKNLMELVKSNYGQYIEKDDLTKIEGAIARNFEIAEDLKRIKLKNSDEPATIFTAKVNS
jgi:hypothetical protein